MKIYKNDHKNYGFFGIEKPVRANEKEILTQLTK